MNNNGLTKDDLKGFSDLLIKANTQQIFLLLKALQEEIYKRT
jgi:hypothetical protein